MQVAVCDDHIDFLNSFSADLEACLEAGDRLYRYSSGFELLTAWDKGAKFDIIFLDIQMPGMSGFDIAKEIRQTSEDALIVIVTSHSNRALESFRHEPLNFLVKPVMKTHIAKVMDRARRKLPLPPSFTIRTGGGLVRIPVKDIISLEIFMGKVTVRTTTQDYRYNGRMYKAKMFLEPWGFFQCHRSVLISLHYVGRINSASHEVTMQCKSKQFTLPVSTDRLQGLLRVCTETDLLW